MDGTINVTTSLDRPVSPLLYITTTILKTTQQIPCALNNIELWFAFHHDMEHVM